MGSRDSTQARILPLHFLRTQGIDLSSIKLLPFDTDVGKHGDTGTSELDVLKALHEGRAQADDSGDLIWLLEQAAGRVDTGKLEAFKRGLFAMKWENPEHRRILELEGLKEWLPPRVRRAWLVGFDY